jgi:hypothetical protein
LNSSYSALFASVDSAVTSVMARACTERVAACAASLRVSQRFANIVERPVTFAAGRAEALTVTADMTAWAIVRVRCGGGDVRVAACVGVERGVRSKWRAEATTSTPRAPRRERKTPAIG